MPVCQLFVWVRRFVEVKTSSPDKSDWRSGLRLLQNYWWTIGLGKQLLTGGAAIHQSIIAKDTWEEEWGTRPPCTRRIPAPPWSTLPSTPPRTWASGSSWELEQKIRVVHCVMHFISFFDLTKALDVDTKLQLERNIHMYIYFEKEQEAYVCV